MKIKSNKKVTYGNMASGDSTEGKLRFDLAISPIAKKAMAEIMTDGAVLYGAWNWTKGVPYSVLVEKIERHFEKWKLGETDENHLALATCRLMMLLHFHELGREDLNDLPKFHSIKNE